MLEDRKIGPDWLESRIDSGGVVLLDGATGTELQRRGVPMHDAVWSGAALLEHGEVVQRVHEVYLQAGADVITANTFSSNRYLLEPAGLGDQVERLNREAVRRAVAARDAVAEHPVAVAGSISGFMALPADPGWNDPSRVRECVREQCEILADEGVDLILLEMMEIAELVPPTAQEALAVGLPVWIGCSCRRSPDGDGLAVFDFPERPFEELVDAVVGAGCGLVSVMHSPVEDTGPGLELLARRWAGPIGAYPNSGRFEMPDWRFVDLIAPDELVAQALSWIGQGVQVVGGCCGLGPDHIRALAENIPQRRKAPTSTSR